MAFNYRPKSVEEIFAKKKTFSQDIGVVYTFILSEVLDPNLIQKTLDFQMDKMRIENPEMTQDQLQTVREMQEKFSSPLVLSAFQIIGSLFIGFIISLIGGLIVKKSRPE